LGWCYGAPLPAAAQFRRSSGTPSRRVSSVAARAEAGSRLVRLQFIDEIGRLPDAQFVRHGKPEAFPQHPNEVNLPAVADGPDRFDLTGGSETGAGLVRELGWLNASERGATDSRTGADLDDFLWLGVELAGVIGPGQRETTAADLVGILAGLLGHGVE
jgi:hypothetical protein